jgi:hypothetical protein
MGYSNFKKISQVTKKFGLDARISDLFPSSIVRVEPSPWLIMSLDMAVKMPLTNEKNKSERLVSPVLMEIAVKFEDNVTLLSGEEISVNPLDDLSGPCDFFFGLHPQKPYVETPIISLVEAKDEDIEWGIGQCAAQLYAAHLMNEQEGKIIDTLYGCATTGTEWLFLKFENKTFYIDRKSQTDLPQILGTWHWIIQFFIDNYAKKYNP